MVGQLDRVLQWHSCLHSGGMMPPSKIYRHAFCKLWYACAKEPIRDVGVQRCID